MKWNWGRYVILASQNDFTLQQASSLAWVLLRSLRPPAPKRVEVLHLFTWFTHTNPHTHTHTRTHPHTHTHSRTSSFPWLVASCWPDMMVFYRLHKTWCGSVATIWPVRNMKHHETLGWDLLNIVWTELVTSSSTGPRMERRSWPCDKIARLVAYGPDSATASQLAARHLQTKDCPGCSQYIHLRF